VQGRYAAALVASSHAPRTDGPGLPHTEFTRKGPAHLKVRHTTGLLTMAAVAGLAVLSIPMALSSHPARRAAQQSAQKVHESPSAYESHQTVSTKNWAGLVDSGTTFTGAQADWAVPAVTTSLQNEESTTWVGVDGVGDSSSSLIQTGTEQNSVGSTGVSAVTYYAWYEITAADDTTPQHTVFRVQPGDQISASVVEQSANLWTVSIDDQTSDQSFTQSFAYDGPGTSAEFVEEAPTFQGAIQPLANFGSVTFSNATADSQNSSAETSDLYQLVDSGGHVIAYPTLGANDSDITVTYGQPPATPAPGNTALPTITGSATPGQTLTCNQGQWSNNPTAFLYVFYVVGGAGMLQGPSPSGTFTTTNLNSGHTIGCGVSGYNSGGESPYAFTSSGIDIGGSTQTPIVNPANATQGYWLVGSDGGIFALGDALFHGSAGGLHLQAPIVGITSSPDGGGYLLVGSDGGVFSYGDTKFYGSMPALGYGPAGSNDAKRLNAPIVAIVPSADNKGYFMVASDGGVFAFGDARYSGSCVSIGGCGGPAVAVMPDSTGKGYWLATSNGNVFAFGDASNYGYPGPQSSPVTSAARTPDGKGYWVLLGNGDVYAYGTAMNYGAPSSSQVSGLNPATAIFSTADGAGYWIATASGAVYGYGNAVNEGGVSNLNLNGHIIAATGS
jgi:hypothetical protein